MSLDDEFERIVGNFLKRAISELNADFGSAVIFDLERKALSIVRMGKFDLKEEASLNYEKSDTLSILNEIKPVIRNKEKRETLLSFKKKRIKSELIFPVKIQNGRTVLFVFPSFKKDYFKEEHINTIKKIADEMISAIEKNLNGKFIILYKGNKFKRILEDFFGDEFKFFPILNLKNLEFNYADFLLLECPSECSMECIKLFSLCRNLKTPLGILRPIEFKISKNTVPIFSFYFQTSLNNTQKRIIEIAMEVEKSLSFQIFPQEKKLYDTILFINRKLTNDWFSSSNVNEIAKSLKVSRVYLSNNFSKLTGKSAKEFINQLRMCYSLYWLTIGRTVQFASSFIGYRERSAFFKSFLKTFGVSPNSIKISKLFTK